MSPTLAKVRPLPEALAWRGAQGGEVVFTNGVFDLLHPGHVELLERARSLGSALVVGLNSDRSARRLAKGAGRPFMGQEARARVVAALSAVDCVTIFDEDTPLKLIEALHPDVLVKGADYTLERIVGADHVAAAGGRVERIPLLESFSTTSLVERIRDSSR